MLRRLLLLSALAAFGSETAFGLGLGEIELDSALNQEFDAEIVLTNVRGLEPQEILPGLASQQDFERVGIDRSYQLTDLRFSVITNDEGNLAVRITSTRPVVEPFLNFLVEVLWPSGRILREYTVLLDPPVFGEQGVERIAAPTRERTETTRPPQQSRPQPTPTPAPVAQQRQLDQGSRSGDEYGMTGPGDTLWAIAMNVRPDDSISVQQMMLALKRANPEAFINDNINLMKAGYVLRIPDRREIREETFQSAVAKVQAENEAFSSYRGGQSIAQMDASPRRPASREGSASSSGDGELRLLASDGGTGGERAGQGGGNTARMGELEDQLSVAEEDLDRARRANAEMNSRLSDLEEQLETLNEIVKLKDDQLAALRSEVQRLQSQPAAAPAQQPARPAASGSLLTNPMVLGGLALLVIIAAAGGMIYMRRKRQSGDDFDDEEFTTIASAADVSAADGAADAADQPALALEEEEEDVSPQTSDVISEAEIYIAYGRFPQAITFLQNAMEAEPNRTDIQLKLLEVFVQTEDATAFNLQLERLKALGDEDATKQALELQQQIPGAAEDAAAAMDATVVSNEPIAAIDGPEDDDDDLSFDLDDLDAETEDDSLDLNDDVDLDDDAEELDIDLDLDDDSASDDDDADLDLDLAADSTEDEADGLDLDLDDDDLDIDLDDSKETPKAASSDSDELDLGDDDLDLDLDLGEDNGDDDDDGAISLDLDDDDDDLDLDSALEEAAGNDDDELDLSNNDNEISLDLDDDDDSFELNLDDDDDDDTAIELNLDDDDDDGLDLDLGDDDDDGAIELNLDDDDDLDLDLGDDDELNLDEDASTKLDLARAYIDMGDTDGARNVLQDVVREGDESEKAEANELLEKI